jgi:hypothetical protein
MEEDAQEMDLLAKVSLPHNRCVAATAKKRTASANNDVRMKPCLPTLRVGFFNNSTRAMSDR